MFSENGADHRIYAKQLAKLAEPLRLLSKSKYSTRVIWMLNQDTMDHAYINYKVPQTYVHLDNVRNYNQLARDHLTGYEI